MILIFIISGHLLPFLFFVHLILSFVQQIMGSKSKSSWSNHNATHKQTLTWLWNWTEPNRMLWTIFRCDISQVY